MLLAFQINLLITTPLGYMGFPSTGAVEQTLQKNFTKTLLTRTEYEELFESGLEKVTACCSNYTETSYNSCIRENAELCCYNESGLIVCYPGKTGTNCTELCSKGHYVCRCRKPSTKYCDDVHDICVCELGWEGTYCEKRKKKEYDMNGPVAIIGVILAAVIVLAGIIRKQKQSIKAVQPSKDNENTNNFPNAVYSSESQHLYQNENIACTATVMEFSIAKRQSSATKDTTRSQCIHSSDYHHIKFNPCKDDTEVTFVCSHLAGNASSNSNDSSNYDVSDLRRSDFVYNSDNGVLRTISEADDTYDATADIT